MSEYEKAMLAAQYMHMSFVDAEANGFLWWGLVYSLAPDRVTDPNVRQKHRDEGLVLVEEKGGADGKQKFVERTKKFFFFKQFSHFVLPGYRRIEVSSSGSLLNSAYVSPDLKTVVLICINASKDEMALQAKVRGDPTIISAFQTDLTRNCETVSPSASLPPQSIRTLVYKYR